MSTENKIKNQDQFNPVPDGEGLRVGIVVAEWNKDITHSLLKGAIDTLKKYNVSDFRIMDVPGAFELLNGSARLIKDVDGIIAIGAVIRGGTPHFDYICQGVTVGLAQINISYPDKPTIFCVLTTDNFEDALDRAGGEMGNKGEEAAEALLKMCRPQITY